MEGDIHRAELLFCHLFFLREQGWESPPFLFILTKNILINIPTWRSERQGVENSWRPFAAFGADALLTGRCGVKPQRLRYLPIRRSCRSTPKWSRISARIAGRVHNAKGIFHWWRLPWTIWPRIQASAAMGSLRQAPTGRPRRCSFSPFPPSVQACARHRCQLLQTRPGLLAQTDHHPAEHLPSIVKLRTSILSIP